jgi:hypothetical protein
MYDPAPIRHIAVQCPDCERWFNGRDVCGRELVYDYELYQTQFTCPVCGKVFGPDDNSVNRNVIIEECDRHSDVYKDIYKKVEKWEKS